MDSRLPIKKPPDDAGQVEEEGLDHENEWNPLVVEDFSFLTLLCRLWYGFLFGGEEVGARHPAHRLRVLLLRPSELCGHPTCYRLADVLPSGHHQCEDDQQEGGEVVTKPISKIVVTSMLPRVELELGQAREEVCIHGGGSKRKK